MFSGNLEGHALSWPTVHGVPLLACPAVPRYWQLSADVRGPRSDVALCPVLAVHSALTDATAARPSITPFDCGRRSRYGILHRFCPAADKRSRWQVPVAFSKKLSTPCLPPALLAQAGVSNSAVFVVRWFIVSLLVEASGWNHRPLTGRPTIWLDRCGWSEFRVWPCALRASSAA